MPFADPKGADMAKERILKALTEEPFMIKGIPMRVEINPSIKSLEPYHTLSVRAFLQAMDMDSRV